MSTVGLGIWHIALIKSRLVGKRLMKKAVSGIIIAETKMKPVVSHCATLVLTLVSSIILGKAGVNTVSENIVIKPPETNMAIIKTIFLKFF